MMFNYVWGMSDCLLSVAPTRISVMLWIKSQFAHYHILSFFSLCYLIVLWVCNEVSPKGGVSYGGFWYRWNSRKVRR